MNETEVSRGKFAIRIILMSIRHIYSGGDLLSRNTILSIPFLWNL